VIPERANRGGAPSAAGASKKTVALAVLAAALGYFVDAYDLILYNILRVSSLRALGVPEAELLPVGVTLLNAQLAGMLVGGFFWGIFADRRGRRAVLFGSIVCYSVATAANGLVTDIPGYFACRVLSGFGLAGELGAGVTLVSELMSTRSRGWGATVIAAVGVLGVIVAALVGDLLPWRTAYFLGGGLGLGLLVLRIGVNESALFESSTRSTAERGSLRLLFGSGKRALRYAAVVLVALPIWFVIGVLVTFAPELGSALGLSPAPSAPRAVLAYYVGLTLGDLSSGALSQRWGSRKKPMGLFMGCLALSMLVWFFVGPSSPLAFYAATLLLGWSSGYWAVFVTTSAEQFGTNLRGTVATTAPNVVRGLTVVVVTAFEALRQPLGVVGSAAAVGAAVLAIASVALRALHETSGRDLNFLER
jgi:MFS family permease